MSEFRFVHLLMHDSKGFNLQFIRMMVVEKDYFNIDDHLFVTAYKPLFDEVCIQCHIEYCDSIRENNMEMINLYGDRADIIVAHSFPQKWYMKLDIKNELYSKLVWRSWGHDTSMGLYYPNIKSIIKNMRWIIYSDWKLVIKDVGSRYLYWKNMKQASQFRAIGIGDTIVDYYLFNNRLRAKNKLYYLPYGNRNDYDYLSTIRYNKSEDGLYHVLVGHSGYAEDNHSSLVVRLKKYEHDRIKLHFVLSYGDEKYIEKTVRFIKENWNGSYEIKLDYMSFEEYAKYLSTMDAAIFEGTKSYALGNLALLLFMGKKLFLNRKGMIAQGLSVKGIPFVGTDSLGIISFEELTKSISSISISDESDNVLPWAEGIGLWKKFFDDMKV